MMRQDFLLAVITAPAFLPGEADYLESLLEAGLQKLHLRKPGVELEELLERLSPRWHSRLVLHGSRELANRYKIPQIHGSVRDIVSEEIAVSTSVHSWEEAKELPERIAYAFVSPLFDSISKPGYMANGLLLQRPADPPRCRMIGLGGIGEETIGVMIRHGWDGAAVLGWLWEEPREAVRRFGRLKEVIREAEGNHQ
jgi:thiamine-phosphate pyrophosphorylase